MSTSLEAIAIDARPTMAVVNGTDEISEITDPSDVFDGISKALNEFYNQEGFIFYAEHKKTTDPETGEMPNCIGGVPWQSASSDRPS